MKPVMKPAVKSTMKPATKPSMTGGRRQTSPPADSGKVPRGSRWSRVRTVGAAAGAVTALTALAVLGTGHAAGLWRAAAVVDAPTPVTAPRDDAAHLLARGDYAGAEAAYRELLRSAPHDVATRYALGIALSYLDRPGETAEQFEWIVTHGVPGRKEVADARHWLDGVARAREPRTEGGAGPGASDSALVEAPTGSVKGVTAWPGITPETKRTKLELKLVGDEPALEGRTLKVNISLGAPYRFSRMRPGRYRLVGRTDTQELWNTPVVIEAGADTPLDLTPQNSAVTPEPVPPRAA
jgi:hypothetical protein